MATESVSSAPPEKVDKEEVKKMEDCPPPKESVDTTKPEEKVIEAADDEEPKCVSTEPVEQKPVDLPPPAKLEEEKVTEANVTQNDDLKHTDVDEEPKGISTEAVEQKSEDKPVEPTPPAEAKVGEEKIEDASTVDKATPEVEHVTVPAPDTACVVAESTIEKEDIKSEPEKQGEHTNVELIEETEKVVYVPKSSPAEVTTPEAESTPREASVPAPVVEDKIPEKTEKDAPETENVEVKSPANEAKSEAPAIQVEEKHVDCTPIGEANEVTERANDAVEVTRVSEEKGVELGKNETGVAEVKSMVAEEELVPCDEKAIEVAKDTVEKGVESGRSETGVPEVKSVVAEELVPCEEKATEDAKDAVEVTGLSEEKGVDPGRNETGGAEVKSVAAEELVPCEEKATEDAKDKVEVTALSEDKGAEPRKSETGVPRVKNVVAEELEDAKDTVEVTGLSEEKSVEPGKSETGVAEVKSVVAEQLVPCEEKAIEDAKVEATSRDIEPVCDKGNIENETTKKVDEKIEPTVKQVDEKIEENPQATEDKEEEKQVNEAVQNQECAKDSEDTKTYEDVRKEDVPVKKQSFVKIMKQSLVKAKKAIIGKSQNPKTPASEPKDDGNK